MEQLFGICATKQKSLTANDPCLMRPTAHRKATAGPSTPLRSAQDDSLHCCSIVRRPSLLAGYPKKRTSIHSEVPSFVSNYKRPLVLTILDGWGYRAETANNAIALAKKPAYDKLLR